MQFNANKTKEVVFSCKKVKAYHPQALLGNDLIKGECHHKHHGMELDSELNFQSYQGSYWEGKKGNWDDKVPA